MRRNPRTRGASWPFRVQRYDDRPRVKHWGDQRSFPTKDEAIKYIAIALGRGAQIVNWRVREGRRTVWP